MFGKACFLIVSELPSSTGILLPEINVKYEGSTVLSGSTLVLSDIDKGIISQLTFTIENLGNADLLITSTPEVLFPGDITGYYTLTTPPATTIAPGATSNYILQIEIPDVELATEFSVLTSIPNNDSNENPYLIVLEIATSAYLINAKSGSYWYFGINAGMKFEDDGSITVLNDGQLVQTEGAFTVSDGNGNLLFYTSGTTVYNANHVVMENGTGLLGHASSATSAVAANVPGTAFYHIITIGKFNENDDYRHSIIDMSANGGLGKVILKNRALKSVIGNVNVNSEAIGLVRHNNGTDWWFILIGATSTYSILLDSNGLNVGSAFTAGSIIDETDTLVADNLVGMTTVGVEPVESPIDGLLAGYIAYFVKESVDNTKIAISSVQYSPSEINNIFIADFNNSTGVLNNVTSVVTGSGLYGIEWCLDDSKIFYARKNYFSHNKSTPVIGVYDIGTATIYNDWQVLTRDTLSALQVTSWSFIALQLGPNGKIYMSCNAFGTKITYLHVIEDAVNINPAAGVPEDITYQTVAPNQVTMGLPYMPKAYLL